MPLNLSRRRPARRAGSFFRPQLVALESRIVPAGLPAQWVQRGSGGGGSLFSPQFSPYNANEITVSSDMSQLFRSTDAGASWQTVDFRQLQGNHESRVFYTEDPNLRYCLDYSNVAGIDLTRPSRSTDGGQTWQPLAIDPTGGGAFYLQADPSNHNRLLITDYTHLWFSADGGSTWDLKYTTANSSGGLLDGGSFWDGSNIYVGTSDGILYSANGGSSFAIAAVGGLPAGQAIQSFAGAKQGTTTRFVAVTQPAGNLYGGIQGYDNGGGESVVTLDWGAANWTVRTLPSGAWPWFAGMALTDINTAYVAGGSSAGTPTVYKTTNGGASWTSVFLTTNNQNIATGWSGQSGDRGWGYGELALGFDVAPNNPNQVIITDFGFAHSSTDGGATWQALYVIPADRNPAGVNITPGKFYHDSGLDNTTAWQVAWADANTLIVGNSDVDGQRSTDGGQSFGLKLTGQTYNSLYRVAVAANGTLYAAVGSAHDLYQSTHLTDSTIDGASGAVLFSTDKGATWQVLHNFGHEVCWAALDPTNANRLYAAVAHSTAGGVYVTNNLSAGTASTWTQLPAPPRTEGHAFNVVVLNDGRVLASYSGRRAGSPQNFTASSGVFLYDPGTGTWSDRSGSGSGLKYWTKDVVVDPFDATQNTWYAGVYSGWGGPPNGLGGLYKTTDRGQTWTRITSGLDRVESVTFNPTDSTEAFLTTETQGLWYSNTAHAASPTFTQVAGYPFRQPERVFYHPNNPNEIWVTSFGNGIRVGTVAVAPNVTGTQVNDGSAQRSRVTSLQVTFSTQVAFATTPGAAFTLVRNSDSTAVLFTATAGVVGGVTVVTLTSFTGSATEFGSLADGRYTLTALAGQISAGGQALDGNGDGTGGDDYVFGNAQGLFRFYGDVNGDGVVNGLDFGLFRNAFGTAVGDPNYLSYLDYNGDGAINGLDFAQFRARFGTSLP
jgi:photosystem II stability/assembly factor-like uncharacterized protein